MSPAFIFPFVSNRIFGQPTIELEKSNLTDIDLRKTLVGTFTFKCGKCYYMGNAIRYSQEQMELLYKGYRDKSYNEERIIFEPSYKERITNLEAQYPYLKEVEKFIEDNTKNIRSILDLGGGSGINCPFRTSKKHSCWVYDLSPCKLVKDIVHWSKNEERRNFDLINCSNVLEHVPSLEDFIKNEILNLDFKYLYIEVPNHEPEKNPTHDVIKKGWHEHINFFTKNSLISLFEKHSLIVIASKFFPEKKEARSTGILLERSS